MYIHDKRINIAIKKDAYRIYMDARSTFYAAHLLPNSYRYIGSECHTLRQMLAAIIKDVSDREDLQNLGYMGC